MKRAWLEEDTKHQFLAESKLRKVLKTRFDELRSELDGNVSEAQLAGEICDYLSCAEERIWVKRGNKRYQATAKEVEKRHADLEIEDYEETTSVIALFVHPNFKMIGEWIDGVRKNADDLGLGWTETLPMLRELLGRAQLGQLLEPEKALVVENQDEPRERLSSQVGCPASGRRLDDYLKTKGIGLTDFASKAQTTDRTLRKFRRTGRVRRDIFTKIATAMGITMEELLKG